MKYPDITTPRGGDTGVVINLQKRLKLIRKYTLNGKTRFLDCGCGRGQYVSALLDLGVDVWGIEFENAKVQEYKKNHPLAADRVIKGNIEKIAFEGANFDVVLLNEVIEHIPNEKSALAEIHRVLKTNGVLIIFAPNRLYPFETHGVALKYSQRTIPHYIPFIPYLPLAIGKHFFSYWARNFWPFELRNLIRQSEFKIISTNFIWQTFENISGQQPTWMKQVQIILRFLANLFEKLPLIKMLGASQFIVARKL